MSMDSDVSTLHIRCGSDIRDKLRAAGFTGDFLEYSDPICEGPVIDTDDLVEVRARYLANGPGRAMGLSEADILARLLRAEASVTSARQYDRAVLWFEHDPYDQLVLARLLRLLKRSSPPQRLELICIDNHPEPRPRFNGLGQLSPQALAGLWPHRRLVEAGDFALAEAIWTNLTKPEPLGLSQLASQIAPHARIPGRALLRFLAELPGVTDGLSMTQWLILSHLAERGPMRIGRMFEAMVNEREPLVFMGDLGFLLTVEAMARTTAPVLKIEPGEQPFPRVVTTTATGMAVLSGRIDYLSLAPEERWVGGCRVDADCNWRFDRKMQLVTGAD